MTHNPRTFLRFFPLDITKKQASDTGMAMVLILLILGYWRENILFYELSIPVLVLNMIYPMAFAKAKVATIWLGLSGFLGSIMSRVLLTLVYSLLVFPVGIFRKLLGKDPMQLKGFGKGNDSVMKIRNHTFTSADIEKPY